VLNTTDRDFKFLHPDHCFIQYIDEASRLPDSQGAQPGLKRGHGERIRPSFKTLELLPMAFPTVTTSDLPALSLKMAHDRTHPPLNQHSL